MPESSHNPNVTHKKNTENITQYINKNYASETATVRQNLIKIANFGSLGGTGKFIVLPVDQGFEHGPHKSFGMNSSGFDPIYHYNLALEAKFSAIAAPLGMLECIHGHVESSKSRIPTILKLNSSDYFTSIAPNSEPDQAITAGVSDAVRLGCTGIGLTIYPGSKNFQLSLEKLRPIIQEAKQKGLVVMIWSYPRGSLLQNSTNGLTLKESHNAVDVVSYAAHIACLIGAHIVKVKLPTAKIYFKELVEDEANTLHNFKNKQTGQSEAMRAHSHNIINALNGHFRPSQAKQSTTTSNNSKSEKTNSYTESEDVMDKLVKQVVLSCFNGRRIVLFSGGEYTDNDSIIQAAEAIAKGGGNGSIIGRNSFQREKKDAIKLIKSIIEKYQQHPLNLNK